MSPALDENDRTDHGDDDEDPHEPRKITRRAALLFLAGLLVGQEWTACVLLQVGEWQREILPDLQRVLEECP